MTAMASFEPAKWQKPAPLSYGAAVESLTAVAAPLFAGFSLAAVGVIGQDVEKFRWPGAAMLAFAAAAVSLIACVQFGFGARQYLYSASDVKDWWPDSAAGTDRDIKLRKQQRADYGQWELLSKWARRTYNLGLLGLLFGLSLLLPPRGGVGAQETMRWVAAYVALGAGLTEMIWIGLVTYKHR
jgi:hypothetical protein